jgi:hypothetical protein
MAGSSNFLARLGGDVKRTVVRRAIFALIALAIAGVGLGWNYIKERFTQPEQPVVAAVRAPAKPSAAPSASAPSQPAANAASATNTASAAKPYGPAVAPSSVAKPVGAPAAPGAVAKVDAPAAGRSAATARAASGEGAGAPVVTAVPQQALAPGSTLAHADDHLTYQYNALGRRDPFQSLVDGAFVGADVGGDAPPDPGGIKVVGIVWGATDQFALVEDVRGNSYVLRKGDKVQNGYVEGLKRDAIVVTITSDNQSQTVEIPLERKGDQNAR